MSRDIHVDHEEVAQKRRQMQGILDDVVMLRNSLEAIPATMLAEASTNTADGGPAPIFGPLLNASEAAVERLQKSLDAVHYRVSADLAILTRMSEEVHRHGEDAARDISAVGVEDVAPVPKPFLRGLPAVPLPRPKPDTSDILYRR